MALLRQAAADAVAAGLKVVLNPFHQRFMGEVSADTVRWVWGAVLQEFPLADFPASAVAFEMVNEPRSAPPASRLRGSLEAITRAWVAQVRAAQPERVLIAPGEMGKVGGGPYRSSRQGLLDAAGWLNTLDVIATFHYYDPRDFTNQDEDDGIKWLGRPWEVAEIASDFAEVSAALDVPVYVGEFGLNSHIDDDHAIEWLESVRESAVAAGFETAVWHLLDGGEGLTSAETAALRRKEWDSNPLAAAAVGSSAQGSQGRRLEQRALGKFDDGCDLDGGRRPSWAVPPPREDGVAVPAAVGGGAASGAVAAAAVAVAAASTVAAAAVAAAAVAVAAAPAVAATAAVAPTVDRRVLDAKGEAWCSKRERKGKLKCTKNSHQRKCAKWCDACGAACDADKKEGWCSKRSRKGKLRCEQQAKHRRKCAKTCASVLGACLE